MNKIERAMVDAVRTCNPVCIGNTTVTIVDHNNGLYERNVYLHGNHIASITGRYEQQDSCRVNLRTLCAYPTRTTLSRLRALGVDVVIRKGHIMLGIYGRARRPITEVIDICGREYAETLIQGERFIDLDKITAD